MKRSHGLLRRRVNANRGVAETFEIDNVARYAHDFVHPRALRHTPRHRLASPSYEPPRTGFGSDPAELSSKPTPRRFSASDSL